MPLFGSYGVIHPIRERHKLCLADVREERKAPAGPESAVEHPDVLEPD
jgi:hypothetical protein